MDQKQHSTILYPVFPSAYTKISEYERGSINPYYTSVRVNEACLCKGLAHRMPARQKISWGHWAMSFLSTVAKLIQIIFPANFKQKVNYMLFEFQPPSTLLAVFSCLPLLLFPHMLQIETLINFYSHYTLLICLWEKLQTCSFVSAY